DRAAGRIAVGEADAQRVVAALRRAVHPAVQHLALVDRDREIERVGALGAAGERQPEDHGAGAAGQGLASGRHRQQQAEGAQPQKITIPSEVCGGLGLTPRPTPTPTATVTAATPARVPQSQPRFHTGRSCAGEGAVGWATTMGGGGGVTTTTGGAGGG